MQSGSESHEGAPTIGLVIVSYHSEPEIARLLQSLRPAGSAPTVRVVVVSNSGDSAIQDGKDGVTVIQPGRNVGYARACNLGASVLETDYLVFCNPDVLISEQCLHAMARLLAKNPEYGTMSPFESKVSALCEPAGKVSDASTSSHTCIGHCFMISRAFFDAIGRWEERLFMYYEDTEFRDRVLDRGKKIGFAENITVLHSGEHSVLRLQPNELKFLCQANLCSHTYYLLLRSGRLAAVGWLAKTCVNNAWKLLVRGPGLANNRARKPNRGIFYHLYATKAFFSLRILANFFRLRSFVTWNGRRFIWQRESLLMMEK